MVGPGGPGILATDESCDTVHPRQKAREREFFFDNLLVRFHSSIVMIRWTGLASWEFEFPFPGSLTTTFLALEVSTVDLLKCESP